MAAMTLCDSMTLACDYDSTITLTDLDNRLIDCFGLETSLDAKDSRIESRTQDYVKLRTTSLQLANLREKNYPQINCSEKHHVGD